MKLSKSRRLLGFWLDGHGVHSREDLLSEEKRTYVVSNALRCHVRFTARVTNANTRGYAEKPIKKTEANDGESRIVQFGLTPVPSRSRVRRE